MYLCKQVGLDSQDMEDYTISMCLDYIDTYIEQSDPERRKKSNVREATQDDIDTFFRG